MAQGDDAVLQASQEEYERTQSEKARRLEVVGVRLAPAQVCYGGAREGDRVALVFWLAEPRDQSRTHDLGKDQSLQQDLCLQRR